MTFRSGHQEKSLDGDNVTLLHCVIYSHFEAHTPPKHGAACLSFFWPIAGVHYGSFYFFCFVSGSSLYTIGHTFCHFHVFHSNPKMKSHQNIGTHPWFSHLELNWILWMLTSPLFCLWSLTVTFAAHTHANMEQHVHQFYSGFQKSTMPFFKISCWCVSQDLHNLVAEISIVVHLSVISMSSTHFQRWNHIKT